MTYAKTTITCGNCGASFVTRSTKHPEIVVSVCARCHPYYTGGLRTTLHATQIDRFNRRYGRA